MQLASFLLLIKQERKNYMETLRLDLINVCYAYVVFLLAYVANILFSIYYNTKVNNDKFDKEKLYQSIKKAIIFVIATFALVIAVDVALLYINAYAPELSESAKNTVSIVMVASTIGRAALKYIVEAYNTFVNVLNGKPTQVAGALNSKE